MFASKYIQQMVRFLFKRRNTKQRCSDRATLVGLTDGSPANEDRLTEEMLDPDISELKARATPKLRFEEQEGEDKLREGNGYRKAPHSHSHLHFAFRASHIALN